MHVRASGGGREPPVCTVQKIKVLRRGHNPITPQRSYAEAGSQSPRKKRRKRGRSTLKESRVKEGWQRGKRRDERKARGGGVESSERGGKLDREYQR